MGGGGVCGPDHGCFYPREGIALGEGQGRAVPEEVCSCEPAAANARQPGTEQPAQKESGWCTMVHTPLACRRSDVCTVICTVAAYLAKDWTVSIHKDLVK